MFSPTQFSQTTQRTDDSPISDLMARALSSPGLVSLAAGFVDHATLPAEIVAESAAAVLADPSRATGRFSMGPLAATFGFASF